tara:strand:+ start:62373 stop:65018 length:2646 start_codon:yes stop_codon:yes gene_type:complete
MHHKFIYFILLLISSVAFSQNITLKGTIKDSLQNLLPYANVITKPKDLSKNLQFAITDEEGYYKLLFAKGDTVSISISYLGYKQLNYQFIAIENTTKNFILQKSLEQLDEIIIEMPVTVKGDTTTFRTDKFITGEERKLKNVLKKLPGVEVAKDGSITVQGKKVTQMLVDGKKFFGGNSKLAVENIPADAVDKVQVIDNYNEIAFLKSLTDSDELAMNIQLKEDKKRFIFGDIEAGKGNQKFYKTHTNLFYYSPKTNLNFIGNLNNIGEKTFTIKDYLSFSGGINAIFGGNFNFRGGEFSQFLENQDVLASRQKFAALNITKTATEKLDVSGYLIFSKSDIENFFQTQNDYTTFNEFRENRTQADNLLGIGKLNLEYAANSKEQWYARTQVKRTENTKENTILSTINDVSNTIVSDRNLVVTSLNQNIEWHKRQSEKHTFSAVINYDYRQNDNTNFWQSEDAILQGLIPIISQDVLQIQQIKDQRKQHFDAVFKHFWELNNSNHIYTTVGNTYKYESFTTQDQQELVDGSINDFSLNDFGNQLDFNLNDFFVGMHYKFRTGIFTIKQGAEIHNYNWNVHQLTNTSKNKWVLLPDFLAKIEFNKSKKIQINYNLKTSFSDASRFANRFYLRSYNSVFKGNENLENNLYHTARIYYSRFSLYRGLIMNASVNYSKQVKGVRNTVEFDGINQFLTAKLFDNPSENMNARGSIYKKIKKIRYKFNGSVSTSSYIQELDNTLQTNKNNNYSYSVGLETLYDDFPTIDIGFKRSIGNFISSNRTSKFTTNEPFVTIDYDFLKGFIFSFDYTLYDFKNKALNQRNTYDVANFTLSYRKENSAWSYKVFSNNMFNTEFKRNSSFSQFLISDTKTFILPRVLMFSIGYNL